MPVKVDQGGLDRAYAPGIQAAALPSCAEIASPLVGRQRARHRRISRRNPADLFRMVDATSHPGVSVVIPARNEEGNLSQCVETVLPLLRKEFPDFEIIIVNDGSTDGTATVADELASRYPEAQVRHLWPSRGFAGAYREGLSCARREYVALVPGDNEHPAVSWQRIFDAIGKADIVVPYQANQEDRPWLRRLLSRTFTLSINLCFGLRLRYSQGPCVYRTALARKVMPRTAGYSFLSEMVVRAIKANYRTVEVPMLSKRRAYGKSRAISAANIVRSVWMLGRTAWDVHVRRIPFCSERAGVEKRQPRLPRPLGLYPRTLTDSRLPSRARGE